MYKLVTIEGLYIEELFESADDAINSALEAETTHFVKGRADKTIAIVHEGEVFFREAKKRARSLPATVDYDIL